MKGKPNQERPPPRSGNGHRPSISPFPSTSPHLKEAHLRLAQKRPCLKSPKQGSMESSTQNHVKEATTKIGRPPNRGKNFPSLPESLWGEVPMSRFRSQLTPRYTAELVLQLEATVPVEWQENSSRELLFSKEVGPTHPSFVGQTSSLLVQSALKVGF